MPPQGCKRSRTAGGSETSFLERNLQISCSSSSISQRRLKPHPPAEFNEGDGFGRCWAANHGRRTCVKQRHFLINTSSDECWGYSLLWTCCFEFLLFDHGDKIHSSPRVCRLYVKCYWGCWHTLRECWTTTSWRRRNSIEGVPKVEVFRLVQGKYVTYRTCWPQL